MAVTRPKSRLLAQLAEAHDACHHIKDDKGERGPTRQRFGSSVCGSIDKGAAILDCALGNRPSTGEWPAGCFHNAAGVRLIPVAEAGGGVQGAESLGAREGRSPEALLPLVTRSDVRRWNL
jgi:hypothetical protein